MKKYKTSKEILNQEKVPLIVTLDFKIHSGIYTPSFCTSNTYEMFIYNRYISYINKKLILDIIECVSIFLVFLLILISFLYLKINMAVVCLIIFFTISFLLSLLVSYFVVKGMNDLAFEYILHDLNKKKLRIAYQNDCTGTISYILHGKRIQLSVYRGYNSHANKRYW